LRRELYMCESPVLQFPAFLPALFAAEAFSVCESPIAYIVLL